MYERFDDKSIACLLAAQERAQKLGSESVDTEHLLLGLVESSENIASQVLKSLGLTTHQLESEIKPVLNNQAAVKAMDMPLSERAHAVFGLAWASAVLSGQHFIGPQDILIGLIDEGTGPAVQMLKSFEIDLGELRKRTIASIKEIGSREESKRPNSSKWYTTEQQRQFREKFLVELKNILAYSLGIKDALHLTVNIIGKVMSVSRCLISLGTTFGDKHFEYWSTNSGGCCEELDWRKSDSALYDLACGAAEPCILQEENFTGDTNIGQELRILNAKSLFTIRLLSDGKFQGLLMMHQCDYSRTWLPEELEWLARIANVIAEHLNKQQAN